MSNIENSILDKLTNDIIQYYRMFKEKDKDPFDFKLDINEFKKIFEQNKKLAIKTFETINVNNDGIDIYEFLTFMLYDDYLRPIEKINEIPENNEEKLEDFDSFKKKHSNNNLESQKEKYKKYLSQRQQKFKRLLTLVLLEEKRTKLKIIRILKLKDKKNFDYFKKTFEDIPIPDDYIPVSESKTPSYMKATRELKSARSSAAAQTPAAPRKSSSPSSAPSRRNPRRSAPGRQPATASTRTKARPGTAAASAQKFKTPRNPSETKISISTVREASQPLQAPLPSARREKAKEIFKDKDIEKKIKSRIKEKFKLVESFNNNLNVFKEQYQKIKEIIKINTLGYGTFFTSINSSQIITSKLNEIINNNINKKNIIKNNLNNNCYCEKIINTKNNINNLKDDDELDESIKIFILLCYFINELNCILNQYDKELKDQYKKDKRFNNIKSINYLQETLSNIIKQRNNINKNNENNENNENINSEFKINDEEMNKVCENINAILLIISKIFKGIHDDLKIELIEEIIPEDEFNRLRKNTAATRIKGTNRNAHETLKRNIPNYDKLSNEINNINKLIDDLNVEEYSEVKLDNNNIKNYVDIYLLLIKESFSTTPRGKLIRDTSKQKILRSIVNLIVTNYDQIKYPEYKFLDADKIY